MSLVTWDRPHWKADEPSRHQSAKERKGRYVRRQPRTCAHCKASYLPPYGAKAGAANKFCTRKCYTAAIGVRPAFVEATCAHCHGKFRRTVAALKRVKHAFCGNDCRAAFFVGERSPMFRGDKDPNRGANWNRRADEIRRRDGLSCRRCGRGECGTPRKEKLSVDHVKPWRAFEDKELANHPDNLVSLCRSCHSYKTTVVERAWLNGDVLTWTQWVRSLHLPSAVFGWIVNAKEVPVPPRAIPSNGNADKTHCVRGHAFTPDNTRVRYGKRECRECLRIRGRARCHWFVSREESAVRVVRKD